MTRLAVTTLEDRSTPAAYTLDPAFGDAGRVQRDSATAAGPVAVQPDGKVVTVEQDSAAGEGVGAVATYLRRYNADGTRDETFASTPAFTPTYEIRLDAAGATPVDLALDAQGRATVLLVGDAGFTVASPGRFAPLTVPTANGPLRFAELELLPDGSALVAGQATSPAADPSRTNIVVRRVTPAGQLDPAGSRDFVPELGPLADRPTGEPFAQSRTTDLLLRPDGGVTLARAQSGDSPGGVVRLTPAGVRDAAFDLDGVQTVLADTAAPNQTATTLFATPDGGVLLAGTSTRDGDATGVLTRLTARGAFDSRFGVGGTVPVAAALGPITYENAYFRPDGSLLLAGNQQSAPGGVKSVYLGVVPAAGRAVEELTGPYDGPGATTAGGGLIDSALAPDGRLVLSGQLDQPATTFRGQLARVTLPAATVPPAVVVPPVVVPPTPVPPVVPPVTVPPLVPPAPVPPVAVTPVVVPPTVPPTLSPLPTLPRLPAPVALTLAGPVGGPAGRATLASSGVAFVGPVAPSFGTNVLTRTASADLTGDGVPDVIAVAGPGGDSRLSVLDGVTGRTLSDFAVFEPSFRGGVYVASADLTGDGVADVVVTPDVGGGPVVAVYDGARLARGLTGDAAQVTRYYGIDDPDFRGGVRPSAADFDGDGRAELVIAAGTGGGPRVTVWGGKSVADALPVQLANFFVFEPEVRDGVYLAAGDLDGDGVPELAFGGGPGGGPRVRVAQASTFVPSLPVVPSLVARPSADFFAYDPAARGGATVAIRSPGDGSLTNALLVGSGAGEPGRVRAYRAAALTTVTPVPDLDLEAFGGARVPGGVAVG